METNSVQKRYAEKLCHMGYSYYTHSTYPSIEPYKSVYYRCVNRSTCPSKATLLVNKGKIKVTDEHICKEVRVMEVTIRDATKLMEDQVRTLATHEPTFSANKIANEVMRANEEENSGKLS